MSADRLAALGPDWPHRDRSERVSAHAMTWHVQRFGPRGPAGEAREQAGRPDDAPRVLLLHGTGASTHSFRDLAPLVARTARVLVPDLPGHAGTDTPRGDGLTLPGMARRVGALCEAFGFAPDMVVGHSAGAAVAIEAALSGHIRPRAIVGLNAALKPMQGYALFSPLAKALFVNPLVPMIFARAARREGTARRLLEQTGSRLSEEGIEYYRRLFSMTDHVYGALGMMARWDLDTLQSRLPGLATPLLLVTAADDRTIPSRDAPSHVARVRNGRHVALDGGGHLVHEVEPERILRLLHGVMDEAGLRFEAAE